MDSWCTKLMMYIAWILEYTFVQFKLQGLFCWLTLCKIDPKCTIFACFCVHRLFEFTILQNLYKNICQSVISHGTFFRNWPPKIISITDTQKQDILIHCISDKILLEQNLDWKIKVISLPSCKPVSSKNPCDHCCSLSFTNGWRFTKHQDF